VFRGDESVEIGIEAVLKAIDEGRIERCSTCARS
jgi:hypothetical protein